MSAADRPLRVAYFVPPSEHFAGIERVVHDIATGLAGGPASDSDVALDVHVVFGSDYDEAVLAETAYTRHVLGVSRLRSLPKAIRTCLGRIRPDVLIVAQIEASTIVWLACRGLGVRAFVPALHGNPRLEQAEGTRRSKLAFGLFRRLVAPQSAAVLAVSPALGRYARQHLAGRTPVLYAPNPVRTFDQVERSPGGEEFRFLNVGRLSRQKGQDLLLTALSLARPELPPFRFTFLGTGVDEEALRQQCHRLGLDDVVDFAGYATDPSPYFRQADAFVLGSRWEGFGVVLVEALRFGLPLLAADCEFGPSDVITDPRIGRLVPAGDPAAMARGLIETATRPVEHDDDAFRREAAADYDLDVVVRRHRALLDDLARTLPDSRSSTLTPTGSAT